MTPKRKFAIVGDVGGRAWYWTGRKLGSWSNAPGSARTWAGASTATTWVGRVPKQFGTLPISVRNLRVVEVTA